MWTLITQRLAQGKPDLRIEGAVEHIEAGAGRVRMDALARRAALSPRGFQMRFRAAVGLAPKEFARLVRLQATLRALDRSDSSVAAVASDRGFADQAHATRELRRVTGLTPARLRAELRNDRDGDLAVRLAAAFVRGAASQCKGSLDVGRSAGYVKHPLHRRCIRGRNRMQIVVGLVDASVRRVVPRLSARIRRGHMVAG